MSPIVKPVGTGRTGQSPLGAAGDPPPAGNGREHRWPVADHSLANQAADELAVDDAAVDEVVTDAQLSAGMQRGHP
jgi:hypothetical protein